MSRETLLALAERVEAAAGPDDDLDVAIAEAVGVRVWGKAIRPRSALSFTASLDAALTLVPEGWSVQIGRGWRCDIKEGRAWASVMDRQYGPPNVAADAENTATPALALTAACLRARAGDA